MFVIFLTAPASGGKKCFELILAAMYFWKILTETGDINTFVLCGVFVSRYVQLKSSFSDKKTSAVKSEIEFSRKAIEN